MKLDEIAEFSTMEKRKSNKDSEEMVLIFDFREIGLLLGLLCSILSPPKAHAADAHIGLCFIIKSPSVRLVPGDRWRPFRRK